MPVYVKKEVLDDSPWFVDFDGDGSKVYAIPKVRDVFVDEKGREVGFLRRQFERIADKVQGILYQRPS